MEIQFTNIDNLWVAEFEVTKDFNLHLERDTEGRLDIYQRTAGGDYEYIYDIGYLNRRTVYDNDFQALVYPKWIKIKSAVKPLIATITTDGEVNEVVYQAKDIEITSNGTTKVTADTGYTALGSVNVKVNVPTEGGGSATPTELQRNDVNFFDYDGTLLYAYTWEEAKELTELPALPVHDGLEVREWNYTLEDIKAQGASGFSDIYGSAYIYAEDVVVEGVKYRAFSETGSLEEASKYTMTVYLLTKEPKIGDFAIGASYYGGDDWELWYDGDSLYQSEIIDVFSTIGKADIGACCYDGDGELIKVESVGIIPRGLEEANYLFENNVFSVISIPNTVNSIGSSCFYRCTCLNEIKIPISVNIIPDNYTAFYECILSSIWWNGFCRYLDLLSVCELPTPFIIPNTFSSIGANWEGGSGYVKFPNIIKSIKYLGWINPNGSSVLDFSEAIVVPRLDAYNTNFVKNYIIIVPDDLYDLWTHTTNWVGVADEARFIKASECSYLIK